jgi:hypothetical protein
LLPHGDCGLTGALRVVGLFEGRTEKSHDVIAHVLFERALTNEDLFGHDAVGERPC